MGSAGLVSSGRLRLSCSAVVGALLGVLVGVLTAAPFGVLVGLGVFAACYVAWTLLVLWPMSGQETRAYALREDVGPVAIEAVIAVVAVGSMAGIVSVILTEGTADRDVAAGIALAAVFCSWAMLHTMYATRYARTYYSEPAGGIDFNTDADPCYVDFCYFSFNLGMTFQVSDTSVSTTGLRSVVLRHCLLSYVFGTVILAATINLVAGIATSG